METPPPEQQATPPAAPATPPTAPATPPAAKPKRKREPRLKPLIEETPALQNAESSQALKAGTAPKKARKPRKKKFKATKFDKAIARFIVKGERSAKNIRDALRVDVDEFEAELARLCGEGLLARGKFDSDYLSFTVNGFDEFAALFKKTLEAEKPEDAGSVVWDARQTLLKTEAEHAAEKERKEKEQDALHKAIAEDRKLLSASFTEKSEIDLEDAFKKGAPNGSDAAQAAANAAKKEQKQKLVAQAKKEAEKTKGLGAEDEVDAVAKNALEMREAIKTQAAKKEKTGAAKSVVSGAALTIDGSEACELCHAAFKIAVSGGHPKYGHCFCGAAYHKDCYEALADGDGKCVRCGKKIKLAMDARSEEAVKELKNVF